MGNFWLKFVRNIGDISNEFYNEDWCFIETDTENEFKTTGYRIQRNRTPWQNIWGKIILWTIPAYSLHIKTWQIYIMPASRKKEKLKRILLSRIGISNILMRLLLGDTTVSEKEVSQYPDMTGYRPGVYLDESCRRDIREMTEEESEANAYEKDLIKKLYYDLD